MVKNNNYFYSFYTYLLSFCQNDKKIIFIYYFPFVFLVGLGKREGKRIRERSWGKWHNLRNKLWFEA